MSEIHYFPRYSQPENFITNNTLLLLLRLHQYNRFKFEKLIESICADQEAQISTSWLQFSQQKGTGKSVLDGFIAQDSLKIAVETKRGDAFDFSQIENHLQVFGDEQHKLMILLSSTLGEKSKAELASIQRSAISRNIQVIHTTFEEIVKKACACLSEHEEEMLALVADYESFCSDMGLLPRDEYLLFVPPCGQSFDANKKFFLYYCRATSNRRKSRYLGIYANRAVRAIGLIAKVVACTVDTNTRSVTVVADDQESLTQDERDRILGATEEARTRNWDIRRDHKFYLCDSLQETEFRKTTPQGIRNQRYFDLEEVLSGELPTEINTIAASLRRHTWE